MKIKDAKKVYDFIKNKKTKTTKKMGSNKKSNKEIQADNIIRNHVIWSMGAGFIPVLIADIFAVSALQLDMIRQLCRVYDVDFQETQGKALVTSLTSTTLARLGARGLIKLIPGIGSLIGGATVSAFAGTSTYALGEVFKKHFESGGTILDFDPDRLRKYYREKFEKGKTVVKEWQVEQESSNNPDFVVVEDIEAEEIVPTGSAKTDSAEEVADKKTKTTKKTVKEKDSKSSKSKKAVSKIDTLKEDIVEKLKKLAELKDSGIITEEEFKQMKQRILDKF